MPNRVAIYRQRAAVRQKGCCCYCGLPVVPHHQLSQFASERGLSEARVKALQCTAEHLQARCEGGADSPSNISAACITCNLRRHRMRPALPPDKYRDLVQRQMVNGSWHKQSLTRSLPPSFSQNVPRGDEHCVEQGR